MTDNHVSAGPMVEIHDADFEAIRKELHDEHRLHCESDHDPYIWIALDKREVKIKKTTLLDITNEIEKLVM